MRKIKVRIGAALVLYSFVITIAVLLCFYYFLEFGSANKVTEVPHVLYNITIYPDDTFMPNQKFSASYLEQVYKERFLVNLPYIIVALCLFVIISSFALWGILKKIEENKNQQIRAELDDLERGAFSSKSNDFDKEYNQLKSRFDAYLDDYKRLNSYITHEQKNVIALFKAKLEARGDTELLAEMSQLSKSIDDVLTISSTSASELELVDAALIVAGVCDEYHRVYKDIIFDFDDGEFYTVMAKEQWIERAISNLIDNAIKFGGNGLVQVLLKKEKGSVIITVQDSGIGIDETMYEKIFDTHYRVRELNKDGYGIGLSLVEHVCDLCDGFVWLDSRKGVGTTFYLVFPQAEK